jgi:hypothetical protein
MCKHSLAVELHRRALTLLDDMAGAQASSTTASFTVAAHAGAAPASCAAALPATLPPAAADICQHRLSSADRWAVTEAPASCCLRWRVGDLEMLYTMRDVTDAELTSRVQHLLPWLQDLLDQACERQALLDTLRQQREATSAAAASHAPDTPADLHARIDHAVQQALAAQQATSHGHRTAAAQGQAPEAETPAAPTGWGALHQMPMEQRSNTKGTWYSHWLADEQRYCKGKRSGASA